MKPRKPQDYVLEAGLDAEVGPDTDGYYPLVRCISRWDRSRRPAAWVPAWSTEFQPEDRIAFRVFDYTAGVKETGFDLKGFEIHFLDPRNQNLLKSPFSSTDPTRDNPITFGPKRRFVRLQDVQSPASGVQGGWVCSDGRGRENPPFAQGEISFTFSGDQIGRFLFRLVVKVIYEVEPGAYEWRIYNHDPEIFIGEGDAPPGPPPG